MLVIFKIELVLKNRFFNIDCIKKFSSIFKFFENKIVKSLLIWYSL